MPFASTWNGSRFVADTLGLLPWEPPAPTRGQPRHGAGDTCWLCGGATDGVGWPQSLAIKPTTTDHNRAVSPASDAVCQACVATMSADTWKAYAAAHPEHGLKTVHPLSWRTYSHAVCGAFTVHPVRSGWQPLLLAPPEPPFLFVLTESGQKHLLYRARVAQSRDVFPVQFEEAGILVDRARYGTVLALFESLIDQGCAREEIVTGQYNPGRKLRDFRKWRYLEEAMTEHRRTDPDLMRLTAFTARSRDAIRGVDEEAA